MPSFGELLAEFKESEAPENIVALVDSANLRNALVAWKSVTVIYNKAEDCGYKDETSQWNWLWQQITYDQSTFGTVAGLKAQETGSVLTRLIGLRLIYPDGTINELATQYLQSVIIAKLPKPKKAKPPKDPPPAPEAKK